MTVIAQQFPYQKIAYNRHFWIQTMAMSRTLIFRNTLVLISLSNLFVSYSWCFRWQVFCSHFLILTRQTHDRMSQQKKTGGLFDYRLSSKKFQVLCAIYNMLFHFVFSELFIPILVFSFLFICAPFRFNHIIIINIIIAVHRHDHKNNSEIPNQTSHNAHRAF